MLTGEGWAGGAHYDCSFVSVLKSSGGAITQTHATQPHYKLRMLVSVWWLSSPTNAVTINIADGATTIKSESVAAPAATGNNSIYCTNSRATNVDFDFTSQRAATSISVSFSASGSDWGIREYIFI